MICSECVFQIMCPLLKRFLPVHFQPLNNVYDNTIVVWVTHDITDRPLQSARIAAPGDDLCESVWQLEIEESHMSKSLDSNVHRTATLTATVTNAGEVS